MKDYNSLVTQFMLNDFEISAIQSLHLIYYTAELSGYFDVA